MKRILVMGVVLCALVLLSPLAGMAAEYTADMVISGPQGERNATVYVKGDRFRQDLAMGGQKQSIIIDEQTGGTFVVLHERKMYMDLSAMGEQAPESPRFSGESAEDLVANNPDIAEAEYQGEEKLHGYLCKVYHVTYSNAEGNAGTLWISEELETPLKIIAETEEGTFTTEMSNIREKPLDDSLFEIPEGFKKVEMPGA
ncbi:MAG: DUF4412 domain-containing protein [Synergistales bacterium]|nr:DUF4412 domain-containing protein [Synergistales bacterium]